MHFTSAVASTAASVIPVFLIAWLLETQRTRLTAQQIRAAQEQLRAGRLLVRALKIGSVLFVTVGAALEVWMLVVIQLGELSGALAVGTWGVVGAYVIAPAIGVCVSMFEASTKD